MMKSENSNDGADEITQDTDFTEFPQNPTEDDDLDSEEIHMAQRQVETALEELQKNEDNQESEIDDAYGLRDDNDSGIVFSDDIRLGPLDESAGDEYDFALSEHVVISDENTNEDNYDFNSENDDIVTSMGARAGLYRSQTEEVSELPVREDSYEDTFHVVDSIPDAEPEMVNEADSELYNTENDDDSVLSVWSNEIGEKKAELTPFEEQIIDLTLNSNTAVSKELYKLSEQVSKVKNLLKEYSDSGLGGSQLFPAEQLAQFKEQITLQLVQLFDGFSFHDEMEEIKDYIEDNIGRLRQYISSGNMNIQVEPGHAAPLIVEEAEDGYNYNLTDVESDLAKMRIVLSEIEQTVKTSDKKLEELEGVSQIDCIYDDIASISKRTNKLILTSEDSHKTLKHYLEEFEKVILSVDEMAGRINISALYAKVDAVVKMVNASAKSDKMLHDALMYLAKWIDGTGETFDKLKEDLTYIKEKVDDNTVLNKKFKEQEEKIEELEEKLNAINKSDKEIKSVLEFISSQVTTANENSRDSRSVAQRLEMLEHQISKFEKNINKIASYIEE